MMRVNWCFSYSELYLAPLSGGCVRWLNTLISKKGVSSFENDWMRVEHNWYTPDPNNFNPQIWNKSEWTSVEAVHGRFLFWNSHFFTIVLWSTISLVTIKNGRFMVDEKLSDHDKRSICGRWMVEIRSKMREVFRPLINRLKLASYACIFGMVDLWSIRRQIDHYKRPICFAGRPFSYKYF